MTRDSLIALALGLVAAVAFVSATAGPLPMRLILFLVTPLPLLMAGLGWGVRASLIAGLAGAVVLAAFGPMVAAVFAVSQAVPAAVLSHLAMLSRPAASGPTSDPARALNREPTSAPAADPVAREWYPPGRLVIWAAIMAAIPALIWTIVADANSEDIKTALTAALEAAFKAGSIEAPGGGPWTPEGIARISSIVYAALPGGSAIAWMSSLLLTLWMAGRIMRSAGLLTRPWPDLASLEFPKSVALVFAAVSLAAILDGPAGIAGRAFFGAFLLAYLLLGLAIIHFITRGANWRPFALWALYTGLLFISGLVAVPVALIGLTDSLLQLRRRYGQPPGTT